MTLRGGEFAALFSQVFAMVAAFVSTDNSGASTSGHISLGKVGDRHHDIPTAQTQHWTTTLPIRELFRKRDKAEEMPPGWATMLGPVLGVRPSSLVDFTYLVVSEKV